MTGVNAKAHYALIAARHRAQVEAALVPLGELLWQPKPNAKESAVTVLRRISPADPATWPELNVWMAGTLRAIHDLFRPIVRTLDAADWTDPETSTTESLT